MRHYAILHEYSTNTGGDDLNFISVYKTYKEASKQFKQIKRKICKDIFNGKNK